ncbi:hypothetical protein [Aeromonas sp. R7-1]|uniref:hypothetical protein n=1 Tax=Aeromonas sp. R7-1 TaxID=3138473 RepID=UPI0034A2F0F8
MSIEAELARALGHIVPRAGVAATLAIGGDTLPVMVIISNDLHVGGANGGFTNRYNNRADGVIANRWLIEFHKTEVDALDLSGVRLTVTETGQRYELHQPVDEMASAVGMITYGAAKI